MERVTWLLQGIGSAGEPIAASLLFLAFGTGVVWLLGVRGTLLSLVAALPVGIALLMLISEALGVLGVPSSLVVDAAVAGIVAATAWAVRRRLPAGASTFVDDAKPGPVRWAGAGLGSFLGIGAWLAGIGDFTLPPQANDDIWHGYLVERLTQMPTITANSVAPALVGSAQPVWHYPYGASLAEAAVRAVTSIGVPEILNGAWLVYVGVLLPLGLVTLAWRLWPDRPWIAFWSGVMAPAATVFPYLTNGVFPFTVALAMIPGFLALLITHLRQPSVPGLVVALSAIGIFVTHPLAAVIAAILAVPVVAEEVLWRWPTLAMTATARRLGLVALLAAVGCLPWLLVAEPAAILAPMAEATGLVPAVTTLVTLASPWTPPQSQLAILVAIGVVASVLSRRGLGLTIGYLLFGGLFICDLARVPATATITGIFLGWYRLLAVVGLIVPILAGLGVVSAVSAARWLVDRIAAARMPSVPLAIGLVVGIAASTTTLYGVARGLSIVRSAWHNSALVTSADVQLFKALADRVGPDDRVLNSPRDGSTWMFALFGAKPVTPYPTPVSMEWSSLFGGGFASVDPGPACRRLKETGATYAIVKRVVGDIGDFDIADFVTRNSSMFRLVSSSDAGAIYSVDRAELEQCVTR